MVVRITIFVILVYPLIPYPVQLKLHTIRHQWLSPSVPFISGNPYGALFQNLNVPGVFTGDYTVLCFPSVRMMPSSFTVTCLFESWQPSFYSWTWTLPVLPPLAHLSSGSAGWLLTLILAIISSVTCLYLPVLVSVFQKIGLYPLALQLLR